MTTTRAAGLALADVESRSKPRNLVVVEGVVHVRPVRR